ncbi:DUF418 domain-containing protein [Pseudonocardia sp. TRM90224]|uniref:DUF418 domain-containing protein n=1 Tax=Pseudonocardia sp. TRM90224 TaxID=2812678 RepID=UPI001E5B08E7|nr:DUF418 domain-containing protein [Pseudonocardia sp. TRM90224]
MTAPPPSRRVEALDVLRGIAILGSLGTNIWLFTDPAGPSSGPNPPPYDSFPHGVEAFLSFLANGKFIALLTVMFGIGLEIQYRSARRRGTGWPGRYLWRATLLFAEGLVHYVLIFEFDVLMGYAVASVVVAFLVGRTLQTINTWMYAAGGLHTALVLALAAIAQGPPANRTSRPDLFSAGSYLDQVQDRIDLWYVYRAESILMLPMAVTLFLVGIRLWRAGVLIDDHVGAALRKRLTVAGLGIGLPLNFAATLLQQNNLISRYLLAPVVAVGILAMVTTIVLRMSGAPGLLRRGVTALGRTALTGYILQNLLASILCYGWGLGLALTLAGSRPWWTIAAWALLSAALMAFAALWLRRFGRGPVELFWDWAQRAPFSAGRKAATRTAPLG